MRTFVIAEIGVNHNGSLDLALELVEKAHQSGAHAAKFQSFNADTIVTQDAGTVEYQKRFDADVSQYEMLKSLELSEADHRAVAQRCEELGIEFMSTAFDSAALDLLVDIGVKRVKVPSGELTNTPYLRDTARRGLPVILSTGMADLDEVRTAATVLREAGATDLTILHCTSAYPTELADANLLAIRTIARELGAEVGYSDHTQGIVAAPIAVALGARVIEKHITLDRTMRGPDHAASLEPDELTELMRRIAEVEAMLGDGQKVPVEAEMEARLMVRRGLKAARNLKAGTALTADDIAVLRPTTGLAPEFYDKAQGATLTRDLKAGAPIEAADLGW